MTTAPPVTRRWLILRLEAPLLSFGAVAIDHGGVIWEFPALSMLTGLCANALGWQRGDAVAHQALQDRLVFAARREHEPDVGTLRDPQNAKLEKNDRGWTTRGTPEGRDGATYGAPHRRYRDYHADALLAVVVTLREPDDHGGPAPSLDDLAHALDRPARPLFVGRKPCLPSSPIRERLGDGTTFLQATTAHTALTLLPRLRPGNEASEHNPAVTLRALWPADEGPTAGPEVDRTVQLADRRNWISGLHGGTRYVVEGWIASPASDTAR